MNGAKTLRVAFIGGPMYDGLYDGLPEFERATGMRVEIVSKLPHPELNAFIRQTFASARPDLDLFSTHTKYAPSQSQWLMPLDGRIDTSDLLPRAEQLSRIGGQLFQVPRNLDVRLLHYRTDLVPQPPRTWSELTEIATSLTGPGLFGFLFPGRDSGLFGTFYELLAAGGGELFDSGLQPAFDSHAGLSAVETIRDLHHVRRVTPATLPEWHYDEISACFRAGAAAMVCDWPGSYHLYTNQATCAVSDRVALAALPTGPAGANPAYGGCHSFAIPKSARNIKGAETLLRWLTSDEAQYREALQGAIPCRQGTLRRVRAEAAGHTESVERWRLLADAQATMIVPPRFAAYPACEDALWRSVQRAMVGEKTPRDSLAAAAHEIRSIIAAQHAEDRHGSGEASVR